MALDDLQHPDCRACEERKRLNVGLLAENTDLKKKLREGVSESSDLVSLSKAAKRVLALRRRVGPKEAGRHYLPDTSEARDALDALALALDSLATEEESDLG